MDFPIHGYNECMIMYILAAASPTHGVPAAVYHDGWAQNGAIVSPHKVEGIRNPKHYKGFGPDCWGLTASYSVDGYAAHSPNEQDDKGVISPTAALSSIVYTPEYSMQVMRHLYNMGDKVFGPFGFYDAFSETDNWYPQRYLAIDQGPIAVMIENYRTGLLWKLFMSHPDVQAGLTKLGFNTNKQDVRQK